MTTSESDAAPGAEPEGLRHAITKLWATWLFNRELDRVGKRLDNALAAEVLRVAREQRARADAAEKKVAALEREVEDLANERDSIVRAFRAPMLAVMEATGTDCPKTAADIVMSLGVKP